jgi:hypothetical protein
MTVGCTRAALVRCGCRPRTRWLQVLPDLTSLNDAAVSPATLQQVRSNESRPRRGGLGSPNHIKESIKIKPRAQGCHITSRDVTFNAEILQHGRDIICTQFEQGQPPEYALTRLSRYFNCHNQVPQILLLQQLQLYAPAGTRILGDKYHLSTHLSLSIINYSKP